MDRVHSNLTLDVAAARLVSTGGRRMMETCFPGAVATRLGAVAASRLQVLALPSPKEAPLPNPLPVSPRRVACGDKGRGTIHQLMRYFWFSTARQVAPPLIRNPQSAIAITQRTR